MVAWIILRGWQEKVEALLVVTQELKRDIRMLYLKEAIVLRTSNKIQMNHL